MKRVAIFGGSFDPVHLGHVDLAKCAKEAADLDRVIFMPCRQSPFKRRTVASAAQRFEMLRLAIGEQGISGWAVVSDFEISRPGPSFSWETVEHFESDDESGDVEWCWILGTDQWEQLEAWAEPEKLRASLTFVVMTRDGDSVEKKEGWKNIAVPFSHPASSTAIRKDFENHVDWLSPGVAEYCKRLSIYDS
jgi:nicotinate-nucleotide adenylyltransferase